jgi:hypothetical protein
LSSVRRGRALGGRITNAGAVIFASLETPAFFA